MKTEKCYPLPAELDEAQFPNTATYIRLHGLHQCMSKWDLKAPFKTQEEVYAACLKKGITWQKLLKFKGYAADMLL